MNVATTGLPTGSSSYGNRVTVIPTKGRVTVRSVSNFRNYSTGRTLISEIDVMKKIESLYFRSHYLPSDPIDRDLYKILCNVDLLGIAYNNLKTRKPGQMTPGVNPETLDGMSKEVLIEIVDKLKNESFQFNPGRRVLIPKASGGTRPLTIASPRDKIVQEAMRMILEAVYEPIFSKYSHGFRPGRAGCHTALKAVSQDFQASTWMIEGDISKCFDSIEHNKLMQTIENKILDRKFTRLI